jgi:ribonuclease HI
VGAWAFVLIHFRSRKTLERADAEEHTTNNRMELRAVIEALQAVHRSSRILVFSDSKYVVDGVMTMSTWKALGWRRKDGALKNPELWQQLDPLTAKHEIEWEHVRGHSGEPGNERVDTRQSGCGQHEGRRCQQLEAGGTWKYAVPRVSAP